MGAICSNLDPWLDSAQIFNVSEKNSFFWNTKTPNQSAICFNWQYMIAMKGCDSENYIFSQRDIKLNTLQVIMYDK